MRLNETTYTDVFSVENIPAGLYLVNTSIAYLGGVSDAYISKVMAFTNTQEAGVFGVVVPNAPFFTMTRLIDIASDNTTLTVKAIGVGNVTNDQRHNRLDIVRIKPL